MGLTYVELEVANPARPERRSKQRFLVDSGAVYSIVGREVLDSLGIKPVRSETFTLANGQTVERQIGNALFVFQGREGASPVIFGEEGDSLLLGMVTLESLGYVLDPFRRELRPLPMILG